MLKINAMPRIRNSNPNDRLAKEKAVMDGMLGLGLCMSPRINKKATDARKTYSKVFVAL